MPNLDEPLTLLSGAVIRNRFMLAPITNQQSHDDGRLSDDEYNWLVKRAEGGFGIVATCAAHVQANGKTWPGQLGVFDDQHIEGLTRLAKGLRAQGSHAAVQLFHGGRRAEPELVGGLPLVAPSDDPDKGAVALTLDGVRGLRDDFIAAAVRCHKAGMDGVELHAAHGFIICQFLSPTLNRREDSYGGTPERRARLLHEIIDGIRDACGRDFAIGVRLSPEGHGLDFAQMRSLAGQLLDEEKIDYLDMSMRNVFKLPDDPAFGDRTLAEWYCDLPRDGVALGVGGSLRTPEAARRAMELGVDFVVLARGGILHHDFPRKIQTDRDFPVRTLPVAAGLLREEGLSTTFVDYLRTFPDFVEPEPC